MDLNLRKSCTSGRKKGSISAKCECVALQEGRGDLTLLMRCSSGKIGGILLCSCASLQVKLADLTLLMRLS
jgi:hypothetical protein